MTRRSTVYGDEKNLVDYLVGVLEFRLAGRDKGRTVKGVPVDVCQLGVLGPWRGEVDEIDGLDETEEINEAVEESQKPSSSETDNDAEIAVQRASEPEDPNADAGEQREEKDFVKRPPSSLGFEILLEADKNLAAVEVDVDFAIYTRHLPILEEQRLSLGGSSEERAESGVMTLADVSVRREISVKGVRFLVNADRTQRLGDKGAIQAALDKAIDEAVNSPDIMPEFRIQPKIVLNDLKTEVTFSQRLSELRKQGETKRPPYRSRIELRSVPCGQGVVRISAYVQNTTPRQTRSDDNYHVLADVRLNARITKGALRPIEILPVPEDYQYDRKVWALGINTSVEVDDTRKVLQTKALAKFEQPRLTTREKPSACFNELASEPFNVLNKILLAMQEYAKDWERKAETNSLGLGGLALAECKKDLDAFIKEIEMFARGIAALAADDRLLAAFKAMNRVMERLAKGFDTWRLFQIAFIVTQLPSLLIREKLVHGEWPPGVRREWANELDYADVLWFATGGGKTEAYLGLISCTILYDRLRGKHIGMSAWLRFPLRMLSVQQLRRAIEMVWETEKERQDLLGENAKLSDPVRLGYFVGASTTPNDLTDKFFEKHPTSESCAVYCVVNDCPACGAQGSIEARPDRQNYRLLHVCKKCETELPLFITDSEIYRFLPSVLVSTVDKIATVGLQQKFGILWAGPHWRCPRHGYGFGEYCFVYGCKEDKKRRTAIVPYDPPPAFHVQDELHLLQEELGAFAGHYETLIRYCEKQSQMSSKVIAATATIEGFEHQTRHIYGVKGARRFPERGYQRYESFYTTVDRDDSKQLPKTGRVYLALRPSSGSHSEAAGTCTQILQEAISSMLRDPYSALANFPDMKDPAALEDLLYYYSATLTYVGSLEGGARVKDILRDSGQNVYPGIRDLNIEYLSSRSSSAEVSSVIHRMDQPPGWESPEHLDAVVATNMISHGVDLERINLMVLDKFPAETSEYIQASSRSGRKKVGLVVVILPSYSLRAASIYSRFTKYHENLDRMVSPIPVNRFAKYAVHRTLPGIFAGLLFGNACTKANTTNLRFTHETLKWLEDNASLMEEWLKGAYAVENNVFGPDLELAFQESIRDKFHELQAIIRSSQEGRLTDALRPKPMTSLRDVDRGISFRPSIHSARFLAWFREEVM